MDATRTIRRLRYRLRTAISHVPALYLPMADMRRRDADGATIVTAKSDLVVEAFPRSGNTFTVAALRRIETRRLDLAHHTHSAAQLIKGVRLGRPSLLIVRKPRDSVLSFVMRYPELPVELALWAWIRFHEKLLPYLDGMVIATFEQVTRDLGYVLEAVNARFGTSLPVFEHVPDNVETCFQGIEQRYNQRFGDAAAKEFWVARPSEERAERKLQMQAQWDSLALGVRREAAEALYRRVCAKALPAYAEGAVTPVSHGRTPEADA